VKHVGVTIVALVALNDTVSWLDVALKPVPVIVTVVPTGPAFGVKFSIETGPDVYLVIESKFPTAS
jgi:hypothetical protein